MANFLGVIVWARGTLVVVAQKKRKGSCPLLLPLSPDCFAELPWLTTVMILWHAAPFNKYIFLKGGAQKLYQSRTPVRAWVWHVINKSSWSTLIIAINWTNNLTLLRNQEASNYLTISHTTTCLRGGGTLSGPSLSVQQGISDANLCFFCKLFGTYVCIDCWRISMGMFCMCIPRNSCESFLFNNL